MDAPRRQLYELGRRRMEQGNALGAIEVWRQILSEAPDDAAAHALLSLCLVDTKRLHAAELEAGLALACDAQQSVSHHAMGMVLVARRRFREAREHLEQSMRLAPEDAWALLSLAHLERLEGRGREAVQHLERALQLEPDDPDVLVNLGEIDLEERRPRRADERAKEALAINAEHQGAIILAGRVLLQRGQVEEAREHALWALREDPTNASALGFLASVKARQSKTLGLWWRYTVWMQGLGSGGAIAILVGAFFLYSAANILLEESGRQRFADVLTYVWYAIVAYTWFGPALFARMVKRELESVQLRPDF